MLLSCVWIAFIPVHAVPLPPAPHLTTNAPPTAPAPATTAVRVDINDSALVTATLQPFGPSDGLVDLHDPVILQALGMAALLGIATTIILVTSMALTADLIGHHLVCLMPRMVVLFFLVLSAVCLFLHFVRPRFS